MNRQEHDKKMAEIQENIEYAHKKLQEHADQTIKNISNAYQDKLLEKIGEELELAKQRLAVGDDRGAEQHRIRAEVYKSALGAIRRD